MATLGAPLHALHGFNSALYAPSPSARTRWAELPNVSLAVPPVLTSAHHAHPPSISAHHASLAAAPHHPRRPLSAASLTSAAPLERPLAPPVARRRAPPPPLPRAPTDPLAHFSTRDPPSASRKSFWGDAEEAQIEQVETCEFEFEFESAFDAAPRTRPPLTPSASAAAAALPRPPPPESGPVCERRGRRVASVLLGRALACGRAGRRLGCVGAAGPRAYVPSGLSRCVAVAA